MAGKRLTGSTGERLLHVLQTLAFAGRPLSLPEITESVQLPKPTVHRLLTQLEEKGFLLKDADARRYATGPVLRRLALAVLQGEPWSGARHAVLQRLADQVGEACNVVLRDGHQLTYIDRVDTRWPLRIRLDVGSHVPMHCTATGKLLLALQPKRVRERLLRTMTLERMTEYSIADPQELEAVLREIRRSQVGTDDQEFLAEMVAVAVPVWPPEGAPVVAVSIHAPHFRRNLEDLKGYLPQLRETADALAHVLYADPESDDRAGGEE